jgi:hypothetical protein
MKPIIANCVNLLVEKSFFIESAFGKVSDRLSAEGIQWLKKGLFCSDFRKIQVCQVVLYQIRCVRVKTWGYDEDS